MKPAPQWPRVVIVGGGFAGLAAAKTLKQAPVSVTVVDRANHHLFQPLLYQVATAALNPSDIAAPIRRILRHQANAQVLLGEVVAIDRARRCVQLTDGELEYDHLILASGATHSYYGQDQWEESAPGLKTIEDALEIRRRVLLAFERAEREDDPERRRGLLTFVIVGGGATGAELAGTLTIVARKTLARDFRRIDPRSARVVLVEAGERILSGFDHALSESARRQLERMGVELRIGQRVTAIDASGVELGQERIEAATVIWAAGAAGSPLARSLGVPLDRSGRVIVEPDLTIPGDERISVVGDLMHREQDGRLVPGVAPAALQSGVWAARNVRRRLEGRPAEPFRYRDKGMLATLGRAAAVAQLGRWKFSGYPAWLLWLFVHIVFLIGFRNRVLVLIQWAWTYFTYDRGARLITGTWSARPAQLRPPGRESTGGASLSTAKPREGLG
ncbi:MAG: NADH dehydrogenase [Isosphaeraceae bacterium]|jgi:NADH dehydrogenase|nr:MAG: NADH dehydrogenase [Isosphaeraceae bacterium]